MTHSDIREEERLRLGITSTLIRISVPPHRCLTNRGRYSIETMHMIRKGQLGGPKRKVASAAKQFYSLAL
jgi:hypothetical protein